MFPLKFALHLLVAGFLLVAAAGCSDSSSGSVQWRSGHEEPESIELSEREFRPVTIDPARAAAITIQSPGSSLVNSREPQAIFGTFENVPRGFAGYALLESRYGYHLQWPPVRFDQSRRTFRHGNIRIGSEISELHLVIADKNASRQFNRRALANDWGSLAVLPEGVTICDSITLE